jgi:hypothetical protein
LQFDTNGDGKVTVDELVAAVNSALLGCVGIPPTATPASTPTGMPTATPTDTPISAQQLAGDWVADWRNQTTSCCFLVGQPPPPPLCVADTVYRITAAPNNQVTVVNTANGPVFGTATIEAEGGVRLPTVIIDTGTLCFGNPVQLGFDYVFTLSPLGSGSAQASWSYGQNTNCQTLPRQTRHRYARAHRRSLRLFPLQRWQGISMRLLARPLLKPGYAARLGRFCLKPSQLRPWTAP